MGRFVYDLDEPFDGSLVVVLYCDVRRAGGAKCCPTAASLLDEQIADLGQRLSTNPDDTCARGYLIAHGGGHVPHRIDHVLWMIENHPEWDGFLLNQSRYWEEAAYVSVRTAWLRQIGPDKQSGTILHHAAVFFEQREPDLAVELLERAIRVEPDVPFHVKGLGALYGRSQFGSGSDSSFAIHAKSTLLSSTNWLIVAGALNAIRPFTMGGDLEKLLRARLGEVSGKRDPTELLKELPSQSTRYRHYQCEPVRLLRRCVDTQVQ